MRLVSNYLRKRYTGTASHTTIRSTCAAFIMGDEARIAQTGRHLDLIYRRGLRPIETVIEEIDKPKLIEKLTTAHALALRQWKTIRKKE